MLFVRNDRRKTMRIAVCIAAFAVLTVMMYGSVSVCDAESQQHVGIYIKQGSSSEYTELKSDSSFVVKERGTTINGTYRIDGSTLTLVVPGAEVVEGRLDGDKIIDNENQPWVKTETGQENINGLKTDESPFPGAKPLFSDQEFYKSLLTSSFKRPGISAESAELILKMFSEKSYTTSVTFDEVFTYIVQHMPSDHEALRDTETNPDSGVRSFLGSLDEGELSVLAKRVNSDLSGTSYRKAFLAAFDEGKPKEVMRGIVGHEGEDGISMVIYELHQPYFDFGLLRWIDATRIRVIKQPML